MRLLCYALAMMIYTCWIEAFPHSNANGPYVFGQQTQSKQHIDCSNSPPMSLHITIEVDLYNHLSGTLLVNNIHDIDLVQSKLRDIFHRNFRIEKNLNNLIVTIILINMIIHNSTIKYYLLNRLFRSRSKKISKLRVTGLCAGNSPGTGEFRANGQ